MSESQQPQGQQNPLSSFGFKPPTNSGTTGTGGFGSFASTPPAFGAANSGQHNLNATTSDASAAPKAPLFGGGGFGFPPNQGQGVQQPTSSGTGGGGIFGTSSGSKLFGGSAPALGGTSGLGGGSAPTSSLSPAPSPLFGGASNPPTASASPFGGGPPAGSPFGSSNNQPTKPNNIFGGDKPSGGPFSAAGAAPLGIFGASANQQTSNSQSAGTNENPGNTASSSMPKPLFGSATSGTPLSNTPAQPSPFTGFGAKPSDASSQPGTGTSGPTGTATLPPLFGGNANSTATSAPSGNASSAPPAPNTPSLFANLPKKPEAAPAPAAATTTPSALSGFASLAAPKDSSSDAKPGGLFGVQGGSSNASKDSSKDAALIKDGASAPSPFSAFSLGTNKDASAAKQPTTSAALTPASTAPATTQAVTCVPAPSMLRGKTVEDIVSRWTTELETHTREFSQFAREVAVWDRTLIENGNYISALYATVLAAEATQTSLDQSLDHVEQQQRHLTATLDQYEKSASEIFHGAGGIMTSNEGLGLADSERDKSYALAANLYTQLDDLSRSLTQMVGSVNSLNLSPGPSQGSDGTEDAPQEDAISTIAGILNAHLASLQWIDGSLKEMDSKVKDAEGRIKDMGAGGARTSGDGLNKSRSYGLGSSRR